MQPARPVSYTLLSVCVLVYCLEREARGGGCVAVVRVRPQHECFSLLHLRICSHLSGETVTSWVCVGGREGGVNKLKTDPLDASVGLFQVKLIAPIASPILLLSVSSCAVAVVVYLDFS